MKRWILHIWMIGVLGMLAASCSQEVDGLEQEKDGKVRVMFTIALDSPSAGSRSIWGDNYDNDDTNDYSSAIGDKFDNYINPDQFSVKLTLGTTTYDVENIAHWQTADNVYEFVGEVGVTITSTTQYPDAKIWVYANMDPDESTFSTNYTTNPNTGVAYIPMWGVQTTTISLTPGERTDLTEEDPIYLLRAMAKVEINMADAVVEKGYSLTNISLNRYNTQGNCLPAGATTVTNTKELHYDNETPLSFNPNTTNSSTTALPFTVTDNHLVFYLPEVANGTKDATDELCMTVTLMKGDKTVDLNKPFLYFRNYDTTGMADNGTPFDIVRNHWYQYNITAVNDGTQLLLECVVQPWTDDQEILDYTRFVSFVGDGITVDRGNAVPDGNKNMSVYMTTEDITESYKVKVAEMSFTLQTPVGYTWYATLITDDKGMAYGFAQRDEDGYLMLDDDGKVVTTAIASGEVGTTATLVIVSEHTGLLEAIQSRLQIVVRNENTGHTYVVQPDVMGGTYYIVQNP